ncbi:putative Late embryogenesis abundant protein, LEA-14 [Rosa chinensis]|uniref:Putative Late embryogenesis abundant protein, LEA-14 n=1 Tax=Rosa chinensis TaxID=74649 RepID=A0A2P6P6I1_ROSCH|nr:late embryogenesis abundant protein At1g64065 [Rosa chinensis]PRQ17548.1 putative Late embryogenesis abundant protein, LEA-14 [Rosa chinensis]
MADQESQVWPLAPGKLHQRSDENPTFKAIRRERSNKCFVYVFTGIVLFSIAILVFALLVLRVKSPEIKLRSVTVKNLKYSSWPPSFNTSLSAQMTVKNPNFGDYEFVPTTVSFLYGGSKVGSTKVVKGQAKVKKTGRVSFGVDLRSNKLPEGANNLTSDINSGMLKLTGTGKVSGKVTLWKIINKRKTGKMDCTMTLVLKSKTIKDLVCR